MSEPIPTPADQRDRILDVALRLMAERGVSATGMRRLADACGLNVATLYHYFPSKADLFEAVISHQRYDELLAAEVPPVDRAAPLATRLEQLLTWIWDHMGDQDDVWRLLLGESLRGEDHALLAAAQLSAAFESALIRWVGTYVADLHGDPVVAARVLRGLVYGFFVENLPLPAEDRRRHLRHRAAEVAALLASGRSS